VFDAQSTLMLSRFAVQALARPDSLFRCFLLGFAHDLTFGFNWTFARRVDIIGMETT
jgi:hypothetical protein